MSWLKLVYSITESESYNDEDDAEDNADSNRTGSYLFLGVRYLQRYIGMMASVLAFPISFFCYFGDRICPRSIFIGDGYYDLQSTSLTGARLKVCRTFSRKK